MHQPGLFAFRHVLKPKMRGALVRGGHAGASSPKMQLPLLIRGMSQAAMRRFDRKDADARTARG